LDKISEDDLLNANLTTNDPLSTPGLVDHLPDGNDEPHVEASYDLNGTGTDEFRCVHGHHRHLKGFVFRKGDASYLVGWQCGAKLYGTKFDEYTASHNEAVSRQTALRRVQDLREAVSNFVTWSKRSEWDVALPYYSELKNTVSRDLPFVYLTISGATGHKVNDVEMPRYLCTPPKHGDDGDKKDRIADELDRMMIEVYLVQELLNKPRKAAALSLGKIVDGLLGVARRADVILTKLHDVETFFHPSTLAAICARAENAQPRRARHFAGLNKLSCKNITVQMPIDFKVPSRQPIDQLLKAITS
jgi:hypothetical protein